MERGEKLETDLAVFCPFPTAILLIPPAVAKTNLFILFAPFLRGVFLAREREDGGRGKSRWNSLAMCSERLE